MLAKGYDSDQARDENGRFAGGSGGEGGGNPTVTDFPGTVGNRQHITRVVTGGTLPTSALATMPGSSGEQPGEHRNRQGKDWQDFKTDIKANGIRNPILITVDHGGEPVISEGNHRRDAAVELGMKDVPVEVRYFGHAEQEGSVLSRRTSATKATFHGNQYVTVDSDSAPPNVN